MKKLFFVLVTIATIAVMASCKKNVIDPIHDTMPVDTTWWSGTPKFSELGDTVDDGSKFRVPLDQSYQFGQAEKLVDQYRRQLTANIVRHYPGIHDEKDIHFVIGSGYAKDIVSGDGKKYSGEFKNELLIILSDSIIQDTIFLACGNRTLSPLESLVFSDLGTAERWRFTIEEEGLAQHLPALQEWDKVTGDLPIPTEDKNGKIVFFKKERFLDHIMKYKSQLCKGDIVDAVNGKVFNKLGQEVAFPRR